MADALRFDAAQVDHAGLMVERLAALSQRVAGHGAAAVRPPCCAVAVLGGALAGGWNFTLQPLQPKFEKLDPFAGLKRVLPARNSCDTLKACLLATLLGAVAALYLSRQWMHHAELLAMPLPAALAAGGRLLLGGLLLLVAVLAVFALVDVPLQRQLLGRRLRMSVEEMKKEMKEVEGNAEVKGKMKLRMREMVNRRMLAAVPRADLVVMNPTHYAVALKYDEAKMAAPRVVAKGADLLAHANPRPGARGQRAGAAGAAAGARAVRALRGRPGDPGAPVRRRGAGAGLGLPAARRHGRRPAAAGRCAAARGARRHGPAGPRRR